MWVYGPPFHPALQANRSDVAFEWINVYNKVVGKAGLLAPQGPFHLVDLYSLAQGEACIVALSFCLCQGLQVIHLDVHAMWVPSLQQSLLLTEAALGGAGRME